MIPGGTRVALIAGTMTASTILSKLASLVSGQNFGDVVMLEGSQRCVSVRVEDGAVTISSSHGRSNGRGKVGMVGQLETLPSGLTFREIAAQILRAANAVEVKPVGTMLSY